MTESIGDYDSPSSLFYGRYHLTSGVKLALHHVTPVAIGDVMTSQ